MQLIRAVSVLGSLFLATAAHHGQNGSLALHPHHLVRQDSKARPKGNSKFSSEAAVSEALKHKIPSLLHFIHLKGYQALMYKNQKGLPGVSKEGFEFCQSVHRHWDILLWDESMARELIKEHYSYFLPTWDSYNMEDKKSDALRVFIMHQYGGLYLDLDVECYRAADDSLKDYDVVLQGTGDEGINNAVMASIPGHPLWKEYAKILIERSAPTKDTTRNSPFFMTGTLALTQTLFGYIKSPTRPISGYLGGEFEADGLLKIYPIGEWFVPCYGVDVVCLKRFEREKEAGEWDMSNLYGRHYFAETSKPSLIAEKMKPHSVTQ